MRTHVALICGVFFATASCAFAENLTVIYRDGSRQNVPLAQSSQSIRAIEFGETTASSGLTVPDLAGIHTLKAKHSGKCLDVSGVGRNNGDNIQQRDCTGGDNQKWRFVPKGGEYFCPRVVNTFLWLRCTAADAPMWPVLVAITATMSSSGNVLPEITRYGKLRTKGATTA